MVVMRKLACVLSILVLAGLTAFARADFASASAAMENPQNPLLLISTSAGDLYLELYANEAPLNVANFLALAAGEGAIIDDSTNIAYRPRYYDGARFHRVIPGFVIQAGSPQHNPLGPPMQTLRDEINADFLGLDRQPVLNEDGSFNPILNIGSQEDLATLILEPLYRRMGIETASELLLRQFDVVAALQELTIKDVYQNQGYRYQSENPSHSIVRGSVALE